MKKYLQFLSVFFDDLRFSNTNSKKRLYLHNNSKGAKFTKGRFWKLAYSKRYESKNIALKEEYKLKVNYNLRKKIKKKFKENENICTSSI